MSTDPEKIQCDGENTTGGYDRMARLMAEAPDVAIFRRFTRLSAESLLHYQSQLRDAEMRLEEIQEEDKRAPPGTDRGKHAFDSSLLRDSVMGDADFDGEARSRQWRAITDMRVILKEYCK